MHHLSKSNLSATLAFDELSTGNGINSGAVRPVSDMAFGEVFFVLGGNAVKVD